MTGLPERSPAAGGRTYRSTSTVRAEGKNPRVIATTFNAGITADCVLSASLEYGGAIYPLTWAGASTVTLPSGGSALSDPVLTGLTPGAPIGVRFFSDSPQMPAGQIRTDQFQLGNHLADATWTVANTGTDSHQTTPLGILGTTTADQIVPMLLGDSIAEAGLFKPYFNIPYSGWFREASDALYLPAIGFGIYGSRFDSRKDTSYSAWGLSAGTHAMCEFGVNDFGDYTLPVVKTNALAYWEYILNLQPGLPMWQTTATPVTNSIDGWTTLSGQSIGPRATNRVAWNGWIKDGCPLAPGASAPADTGTSGALRAGQAGHPLRGVIDLGGSVESSTDSGLWRVDLGPLTGDGTHPNLPAGNNAMSPVAKAWMASLTL